MVLVGDRPHQGADVERLLAVGVGRRREDVADRREVAARERVRVGRDVAVVRVARRRPTRARLARRHPGVLVVREQDAVGVDEVLGPVLRLPVGAHDAVVAADAEVVLGRDATGEVERLLAGEHHRGVGRHDEDALGVHEHRRLGVPVRLRPDVDAGDDDVDLVPGLGELDDPLERLGHPVHVLGAGVHRDARAGRQREPLDRQAALLGEVERGDDPGALGLGHGAQGPQRVAAEQHPADALGVQGRRRRDQPADQARRCSRRRGGRPGRAGPTRRGRAPRTDPPVPATMATSS